MRYRLGSSIAAGVVALSLAACSKPSEPAKKADAPAQPTPWGVAMQPMTLPAASGSSEAQLTTASGGTVLSWVEQAGDTATLKFALRNGTDWSVPTTVASGKDWFLSSADVPAVMRLSDGTLVAHWYRTTKIELEAYDLWMSYSRDNGKTWARPFTPHHDRTITQHGFATMYETPAQGVGVVWLDARNYELEQDAPDGGAVMLRQASFDAAWKQTADNAVNLRVCECCTTSVAVTGDGPIVAFRDRTEKEVRNIAVSRLDAGKWSDAIVVHDDNWEIDSCPVNGPAISARGQEVAAAWFNAKDNRGHAYVAFSHDGGRTWGAPITLDDGTALGYTDIELLDDGSAAVSWVEFAGQRARLRLRHVDANGTKSASMELAGGPGSGRVARYPRIARTGDDLLLVWTESAGGEEGEGMPQIKGAVVRIPRPTAQ